MTRHRWTTCFLMLVLALPASLFAQSPQIRISSAQSTPAVKPIPVSPEQSNHITRTVQFQTALSAPKDGTPQIPDILTGRKSEEPTQAAPTGDPSSNAKTTPPATVPGSTTPPTQLPPKAFSAPVATSSITTQVKPGVPQVPSASMQTQPATTQAGQTQPSQTQAVQTQRVATLPGPTSQPAQGAPLQGTPAAQVAPAQSAPVGPAVTGNAQYAPAQNGLRNGTFQNQQTAPSSDTFTPRQSAGPGVVYSTQANGQQTNAVTNSINTQVVPKQGTQTFNSNPQNQGYVAEQNGFRSNDQVAPPTESFNGHGQTRTVIPSELDRNQFDRAQEIQMPQRQFGSRSFLPETPTHEIEGQQKANSDSMMTLHTSSPLVKVSTIGPKAISVNKTSTYKVNVSNLGSAPSGSLLIAVDLPGHVELDDADLSSGTPEVEEGENATRILWTIENVQGQSQENMLVKVIPRQPLPFDLDVEWTFVPFSKGARVQVTEPRLTMEISGPSEVKYGEKAIYTITLNNPGTGDAEEVVVSLSETLGGEQAAVGTIKPGDRKQFEVELIARDAGQIELGATVSADGEIRVPASKPITVRRAKLEVIATAPNYRYAGSDIVYDVTVTNVGDAVASNVESAIALPKGAEYIGGIDGASISEDGDALRWKIGTMTAGSKKTYTVRCILTQPGTAELEAGARGDGQLVHSALVRTKVDALADLTMVVVDPRGPQQVGDEVEYMITVENRGTKEATNVKLVGQFSPGIEPTRTDGLKSQIVPGSVAFETIPSIPVGRKISLKVYAKAADKGNHTFRAELNCVDQDIRRVHEGTTKYFVAPEGVQQGGERISEGTINNGFSR